MVATKTSASASHSSKEVAEILGLLDKAQKEDENSNRKGEPSLAKIFLVDSVHGRLLNKKIHLELLDSGVLTALKKWLEPLPDGSLPHDTVKKSVLDILFHFTPEKEHLVESGVGKIIFFYQKNPYETKPIKKLAKQLVLKWIELTREEKND